MFYTQNLKMNENLLIIIFAQVKCHKSKMNSQALNSDTNQYPFFKIHKNSQHFMYIFC